jgi:protein-tyrosine phosphatase
LTILAVVVGVSIPKPAAPDETSPRVLGARADCSAATACTVAWEIARAPVRIFAGSSPTAIDRAEPRAVVREGVEVTLPVVDPDQPTYFEVVPRGAKHGPIVTDRNLRLSSAPATRDLGGYQTYDGKRVRFGRMYRSPGLDTLTDADRMRLEGVGLPTTCMASTRAPVAATHVNDDSVRAAVENITTRATREQHRALLRSLAGDPLPQFVQCTLLDDRTGWPAALVLTTLGVPRETVVADYLNSTAGGKPPQPQRAYLDAGFESVRKRYKTFDRYLTKGLELDEATYRQLRRRLLSDR